MKGFADSLLLPLCRTFMGISLLMMLSPVLRVQAQQIEFPTETAEGLPATHIVQKGETLYGLSKMYKTPSSTIKKLNGLTDATIYPGQVLIVKEKSSAVARSAAPGTASRSKPVTNQPVSRMEDIQVSIPNGYVGPSNLVAAELQILEETPEYEDELPIATANVNNLRTDTRVERPATDYGTDRGGYRSARDFRDTRDGYRGASSNSGQRTRGAAAPATSTRSEWYRVQEGDDIYSIADTYEVRPEDISSWNDGIQSVRAGDILQIQKPTGTSTSGTYRSSGQTSVDTFSYTFRSYQPQSRHQNQLQAAQRAAASYNTRGLTRGSSLRTAPTKYIENRGGARAATKVESGRYSRFEYAGLEGEVRFYAVHKTLPTGTRVKMGLPDNPGYIEVVIVGQLSADSPEIIGLSPACLQILEGSGNPATVTIAYE